MTDFARLKHILFAAFFCAALICFEAGTPASAAGPTTKSPAIATVRAILNSNKVACRIDRIQSIAAVRSKAVWKVTARLVMSASGRPSTESVVWNVRLSDGKAVAASQLASEIESGCP